MEVLYKSKSGNAIINGNIEVAKENQGTADELLNAKIQSLVDATDLDRDVAQSLVKIEKK